MGFLGKNLGQIRRVVYKGIPSAALFCHLLQKAGIDILAQAHRTDGNAGLLGLLVEPVIVNSF